MLLKLLNLNIYGGKYYKDIVSYVLEKNFDILCFQEIKGGKHGFTNADLLTNLKKDLNMEAAFALTTNLVGDKSAYDGNAIFYKKSLNANNRQVAQLYLYAEVLPGQTFFNTYPRNAISLDFSVGGKTISIINTQLAWNIVPKETQTQTEVGQKLFEFVNTFKNDYLLMGDFNLEADSNMVSKFSSFLTNLTIKNNVTNTLNPRVHRAKGIFPKGLAVDFIFATSGVNVSDFKLLDDLDLSDHFGTMLTFEL